MTFFSRSDGNSKTYPLPFLRIIPVPLCFLILTVFWIFVIHNIGRWNVQVPLKFWSSKTRQFQNGFLCFFENIFKTTFYAFLIFDKYIEIEQQRIISYSQMGSELPNFCKPHEHSTIPIVFNSCQPTSTPNKKTTASLCNNRWKCRVFVINIYVYIYIMALSTCAPWHKQIMKIIHHGRKCSSQAKYFPWNKLKWLNFMILSNIF